MWVMKKLKMDWAKAEEQILNELNELDDHCLKAYESSAIYKEKMMMYHDQRIEKREFTIGNWCFYSTLVYACFRANSSPSGHGHSSSLKRFHMERLSWRIKKAQSS